MSRAAAHLILFLGLFCVSTAGPFLVMAKMDAYAVVFLRMAFSAVLLLAWAAVRGELRLVKRAHVARIVMGALLLAGHFTIWVKAFDLTDYASNLLLLVAQPVIGLGIGTYLGEKHGKALWLSIALAIVGLAVIAGGDFALGGRALLGDLMCVVAALAITLFYVVTHAARAETPLSAFMGITFAVGAVAVVPVLAIAHAPVFHYPAAAWRWLGLLVVVTTVAGHGLTNLAARHVRLFTLNIVIVLEPAIAIAMGAVMFGAAIHTMALVGGIVLVASVVLGLTG